MHLNHVKKLFCFVIDIWSRVGNVGFWLFAMSVIVIVCDIRVCVGIKVGIVVVPSPLSVLLIIIFVQIVWYQNEQHSHGLSSIDVNSIDINRSSSESTDSAHDL